MDYGKECGNYYIIDWCHFLRPPEGDHARQARPPGHYLPILGLKASDKDWGYIGGI